MNVWIDAQLSPLVAEWLRRTFAVGATCVRDWVHWFNTGRLLEALGYVPPAAYEAQYYEQAKVA